MEEKLEDKIRGIISSDIEKEGYEIVDIKCSPYGGGMVIMAYIDKPGGVTLSDCSRISHTIEFLLGGSGISIANFDLEVSSPGLDRPLVGERDFLRNKGRAVTAALNSPVAGKIYFEGKIIGFADGALILETDAGAVNIPAGQIAKAKLKIEFR